MKKLIWMLGFTLLVVQLSYGQNDQASLSGIFQTAAQGGVKLPFYNNPDRSLRIDKSVAITFADFKKMTTKSTPQGKTLSIKLNKAGKAKLIQMTQKNLQKPLVIVFEGEILSAPLVQETITSGNLQITGIDKKTVHKLIKSYKKDK
ncbi:SecDF P1 head subdomain-containing protein [Microscilla marina]|uniref:Acriflavin resistance protein:SecD/SecF/SecDF export membrane protein:SecF protein:SecD export membrane protein n=1 Tax=Microscilla marina ATCC 23134 TaxID=313606 RepID=A1ZLN8_MICM2|nr:hypothetical protein [Microscilla marina]EAY28792.1 acriflavin resistance protein:SecD/SecF/SecDF export membrane protein:SecF protein:SecD export membrane protein [Microscilla marina ATCC 23134]